MTLPFALPDWVPPWVPVVVLVLALLWGLAFLFVPFSVLGTRSRLESIEARLDEIQGEIRSLSLRMPEPGPLRTIETHYAEPPSRRAPDMDAPPMRPPIPPPPADWDEPREDWPTSDSRESYQPREGLSPRGSRLAAEPRAGTQGPAGRRIEPRLGRNG
ncbi:MAG TPA: hypothetical protein VJY39_11525 [Acidisphaera sp.]|nr:hypothetical protein [Acidisphaera sp.]